MNALSRLFVLILGLLLVVPAAWAAPTDAVTVTAPDGGLGDMFIPAGRLIDELGVDYTLEEHFMAGASTVYTYNEVPVPGEIVVRETGVPYKTRILIRKPTDPADFTGTVVVEWLNSTAGFDTAPVWHASAEYFTRKGWIYVGVTNSNQSTDHLVAGCLLLGLLPPATCGTRYTSLSIPKNGAAFEMVSQIANLLKTESAPNPLFPDYPVERLYHSGQSQQGGSMVTYATAFHFAPNDGYFVQAAGSARAINFETPCEQGGAPAYPACTPTLQGDDRLVATDVGVPVFRVQTETDMGGVLANNRRQSDDTMFRYYETAGTSHVTVHKGAALIPKGVLSFEDPLFLEEACAFGVNTLADGPVFGSYLYNAMWENLEAQAVDATSPPSGDLLATTVGNELDRDVFGNVLGGIRLPAIDLPLATYGPHNSINPNLVGGLLEPIGGLFCVLAGTDIPFDEATISATYPDFELYVNEYNQKIDELQAGRFLLAEDAAKLRRFIESKDQKKCLGTLGKGFAGVAKAQRKAVGACIKNHAKGKLGPATVEECFTADTKGKVAGAELKNTAKAASKCSVAADFGAADAAAGNTAAKSMDLVIIDDIYGTDADAVLADAAGDADTAGCQTAISKTVLKCNAKRVKAFVDCQKRGLKSARVNDSESLGACISSDPKGKVADACSFIRSGALKGCGGVTLSDAFPGPCESAASLINFGDCVAAVSACRVCQALNAANSTALNCDKADDGMLNESCS